MSYSTAIAGFKFAVLAGVAGLAFVCWLRAPVLDTIPLQAWWTVGFVGAAAVGMVGGLAIKRWFRVGLAETCGMVAGAAWAEFRISDVRMGLLSSLVAALDNEGLEILGPFVLAGFAGAFLVWLLSRHEARSGQSPA